MKKARLIGYGVIGFVVIASLALAAVGYFLLSNKPPVDEDAGYTKTIVYLGDSISEGLLGASPLSERDSYGFYAVVGRRNNYRYVESSVSGDTTMLMHRRLTGTDTPSLERQYWVSEADIIHISIFGNDLLGGNIGKTACEALSNNYTNINAILSRAEEYLHLSLTRIRELNPDAVIMINTVYNPLDPESSLLSETQKAEIIELGEGENAIRDAGTDLLTRLNGIFYTYLEAHPGAYEIIDVYTAFNNAYVADRDEGVSLFYGDWLHPSNKGHSVMADLIQEKLEALGLADNSYAVRKYKELRTAQLDRLYTGTSVNMAAASAGIAAASTCEGVTKAYFNAVQGVTPLYTGKRFSIPAGELFSETKTFRLSALMLGSDDLGGFLDKEKSVITYGSDGTFSIKLTPNAVILAGANIALFQALQGGGINLENSLGTGNFATGLNVYIENIFLGFDFRYLQKDLELLTSCGIYVNGLDFESANMKKLADSLAESMTIPQGFIIPSGISVELKGYYFIDKAGEFTNIHMCVGAVSQDGFPFLYATLHTDEDGSQWIETSIEVSKITLTAR